MEEREVSPLEVEARRANRESLCLIDVREEFEWNLCRIEGANLVPMNAIPGRLAELAEQAARTPLIVYCHHGVRSLHAVNWLQGNGVLNCRSMAGGIERWSLDVDPAVPRY